MLLGTRQQLRKPNLLATAAAIYSGSEGQGGVVVVVVVVELELGHKISFMAETSH